KRPGAIRAKLQDVAPDAPGRLPEAVRLREEVPVEQSDEVREPIIVAVMRRGGQEEQVVRVLRELLCELVPLRAVHLVAASRSALRVGAAFVSLVDDDEVPALLPDPLSDVVLLGVVYGGDDLGL